jgi:hypothetical protein
MQRAQRGIDNPALNVAVDAANALGKPVVVFFVSGHGFSRADPDNDTTALATTVAPAPTRRLTPLKILLDLTASLKRSPDTNHPSQFCGFAAAG